MLFVVNINDNRILYRIDAWAHNAYENAIETIKTLGYKYAKEEITFNGDMVIWVE